MTQLSKSCRSRILPQTTATPEKLERRKVERHQLGARCRAIFERIRPQLIENHYNWLIAIDADSENYLVDPKLEGLLELVRLQYTNPNAKLTIFRLNETGACGTI
jgi:hypothetical protein